MNLDRTNGWRPLGGEAGSRIIVGKVIQIGFQMGGIEWARSIYEKYM